MRTDTRAPRNNRPTVGTLLYSRRSFLQTVTALVATGLTNSDLLYAQASPASLRYRLRREEDELSLVLTTIGYGQEVSSIFTRRKNYLEPTGSLQRLIFTLPPQYFAETALEMSAVLPAYISDDELKQISLLPAGASQIVLQPRKTGRIELTLDSLLAWQDFDLVLPDSAANRQLFELEYKDAANQPTTQVEVPWGITLTPIEPNSLTQMQTASASKYQWIPSTDPKISNTSRTFSELWSAALEDRFAKSADVPLKVLSVRGFKRLPDKSDAPGEINLQYKQDADLPTWLSQDTSSPYVSSLSNFDRLQIANSFSDRFPHDANHEIDYIQADGSLSVGSGFNPCYIEGNAIQASEMRVSSRGAALNSTGTTQWRPGCALSGWNEAIYDGRDQEVEVIRSGWLYPFGIFALLITRTERAFLPDSDDHFVAPLITQNFIRVPQPNAAVFSSTQIESVFQTLTITTEHTPPLDIESPGDPQYSKRDYFIPTVGGKPFCFQHRGTDWEKKTHGASMPLIFVANGQAIDPTYSVIWEPGSPAKSDAGLGTPQPFQILKHGEGVRVVDRLWNQQSGRFARYADQIAISIPLQSGDTTQYVEWVEWARSMVPNNIGKPLSGTAIHPFEARSRTMQLKLHAVSLFSQVDTFALGTYRDTRYVDAPVLDPEPTAVYTQDASGKPTYDPSIYLCNILGEPDPIRPYLYLLETSAKVSAVPSGTPISSIYYGCSLPGINPVSQVLGPINNEIQFGTVSPTDTMGGLATPDTHCSALNRAHGILGDSTFNDSRWAVQPKTPEQLQASLRLDYAAYRVKFRGLMDQQPFDPLRNAVDLASLRSAAAKLMGFTVAAPRVAGTGSSSESPLGKLPSQLKLGDMFGQNAELIPGITFSKIFDMIGIDPIPQTTPQADPANNGRPLSWQFSTFGTDWILGVIGSGPDRMSVNDFLAASQATQPDPKAALRAPMGARGSLNWETSAFPKSVSFDDVGVVFVPGKKPRMVLSASVEVTLGLNLGNGSVNLVPGKPQLAASARMESFNLTVFKLIEIDFNYVQFNIDQDGKKKFDLQIGSVGLTDEMGFIKQLASLFGSLGNGFALDIDPQRAKASLTMRFPAQEGTALFIGPAQIINLAVSFSVTIPLLSRDALSTGFAISSREKPLTIYIPPWYGGTSYFLTEATTKGLRMLEISMEYGGVIAASWGPAKGVASLTAGIYYGVDRKSDPGSVLFLATVQGLVDVSIAGFIEFKGTIKIGMGIKEGSGGKSVYGVAEMSVSIKIGFVTVSYSFSATHQDDRHDGNGTANATPQLLEVVPDPPPLTSSTLTYSGADPKLWDAHPPIGKVASSPLRKEAYLKIIEAYKSRQL